MCPLWGAWEDHQCPILFWDPLYITETNGARKLQFGVLVGLYEYYGFYVKICPLQGVWENQHLQIFILRPSPYVRNEWS